MRAITLGLLAVLFAGGCSNEAVKRRHVERGQEFVDANRLPEAIIEFRNAVSLDELWGEARLKLAEAYAANGEPEQAYRHFIRAADLLPTDNSVQLKAASYLLLSGHFEDAQTRVVGVLERDPHNVEAQIMLGNALAGLRDFDGAITKIARAIELDPRRSQAYANLARVHVAEGQVGEARAAFEKAVQTDPNSIPAHLALANFYWSQDEVTAAEQSLQNAIALDRFHLVTNRVMATLYLASDRPQAAEAHLKLVAEVAKTPESQLSLADYYLAYRRPDDARRVLQSLLASERTRAAAETRLSAILYEEGHRAEASRLLEQVIAREPGNATALVLAARWLLIEGRPELALERAKEATAASPELIPAHYVRADAEARSHRTADAIKSLLEVLKLNPSDAEAQTRVSALHLARNETDSAVHLAAEAIANAPRSLDARLALVRGLIARGDVKLAAGELQALNRQAPPTAAASVVEASLHMRMGNGRAARVSLERAQRLDSNSHEALVGLISLDVLERHVDRARNRLKPWLDKASDNPAVFALAGRVFLADGDLERAEATLRRAIDLDPTDIASFGLLAQVVTRQRRVEATQLAFDEISRKEPNNLTALLMGAILTHAQGKLAEAESRYERILKINPRAALAANNLAALYADKGENLKYAQELAESALEQYPTHPGVRDTLGWVLLRKRLYGPAIRQFLESVAAEPGNAVYQYHLGLAYAQSGELGLAKQSLREALRLNPELRDAQHALSSLG